MNNSKDNIEASDDGTSVKPPTSKTSEKRIAMRFIGGVLLFVGSLSGIFSTKTDAGPETFDAILFISGITLIIVSSVNNRK